MVTSIGKKPFSVREASKLLGITSRAVRFRMESGKLEGAQIDGKWVVYLPSSLLGEVKENGHVDTEEEENGFLHREEEGKGRKEEIRIEPSIPPQMQAIMDQWLAPIMVRVETLARENGKLAAERELDGMEISRLKAELEEERKKRSDTTYPQASKGFWGRVFRT